MKNILLKIATEGITIKILSGLLRSIETNRFCEEGRERALGWNATIETAVQSKSLGKLGGHIESLIYPVWIPPKKAKIYGLAGRKGTYYSLLVTDSGAEFFLRQSGDIVGKGDGHGFIHLVSKLPSYVIDKVMTELLGHLDDKLRKFLKNKH